ncbi:MAG: hypothetical protein ACREC1_00040 [Methylovirgula sp.]
MRLDEWYLGFSTALAAPRIEIFLEAVQVAAAVIAAAWYDGVSPTVQGAHMRRYIEIDGKRYLWRDILKLRREQRDVERKTQLVLFELQTDSRVASQKYADGRYREPILFKID